MGSKAASNPSELALGESAVETVAPTPTPTPDRLTYHGVGSSAGVNHMIVALIPLVFVLLLAMRHWGFIAVEPLWVYGLIFGLAGAFYVVVELHTVPDPSDARLNVQIAVAAITTTAIVYVTGWGPAMIAGYSTAAVLAIVRNGSRTWRLCIYWNLAGIVIGQVAIGVHWVPSKLPIGDAEAIAILAAIGFVAMMRIAALEAQQKEEAEGLVRANEERFRSLLAHSSDLTILLDSSGSTIRYASPATKTLLQRDPATLIGSDPESFVHGEDLDQVRRGIAGAFDAQALVVTEFRVLRADGTAREVECVITDLRSNPAVMGFVVNLHDVTERQRLQRNLEYRAHHDPLTGLPNRQFMFDRLEEALTRCRRQAANGPILMFLDLDRFKEVNDRFGHATGDALLVQFGDRLRSTIRESDLLARFGGDEFVILCESIRDEDAAVQFANRALGVVQKPFIANEQACSVGLSVGIALVDPSSTASEALLLADMAMYDAKQRGDSAHVQCLNGYKDRRALVQPAGYDRAEPECQH
jgi:diguanylate cyclase (GGDEF)-like protein/PAS domain S-box-containing protein